MMNRRALATVFFSLISCAVMSAGNPVEWDLCGLSKTPAITPMPCMDTCGIKAVLIDGIDYKGEATRFFAYYGLPEGAFPDSKVPAMVLVHGGLGTAYWEWVKEWNKRGYAAISMDTTGKLPTGVPGCAEYPSKGGWALLPDGLYLEWGGFERGLRPVEEQWPYCAVAEVILAHSFILSLPEIDESRTGLTGNSWGGFLTLLTAAVDKRFKFAAPVYACGFFEECPGFCRKDAEGEKWRDLFDPKHYIPQIDMPVLWVAGTNDFAFDFGAHQKSMAAARSQSYKSIKLRMIHTDGKYKEGQPDETYALADHFFKGAQDLPIVQAPVIDKKRKASFEYNLSGREVKSIELLYTTSGEKIWKEREWFSQNVEIPEKGTISGIRIPEGTTAFYFNINTTDGLTASSSAYIF